MQTEGTTYFLLHLKKASKSTGTGGVGTELVLYQSSLDAYVYMKAASGKNWDPDIWAVQSILNKKKQRKERTSIR